MFVSIKMKGLPFSMFFMNHRWGCSCSSGNDECWIVEHCSFSSLQVWIFNAIKKKEGNYWKLLKNYKTSSYKQRKRYHMEEAEKIWLRPLFWICQLYWSRRRCPVFGPEMIELFWSSCLNCVEFIFYGRILLPERTPIWGRLLSFVALLLSLYTCFCFRVQPLCHI